MMAKTGAASAFRRAPLGVGPSPPGAAKCLHWGLLKPACTTLLLFRNMYLPEPCNSGPSEKQVAPV